MRIPLTLGSRRHRPLVRIGLSVLAVLATAAACGSPGSSDTPAAESARSVDTEVGAMEGVVDITIDSTQVDTLKPITDAFTKLHPAITFDITGEDFAALQQSAAKRMAGDEVPDLISLPTPGNTVKDGLVLNLDPYAAAYGWNDFPASQLDQWRIDDEGVRGQGSLYGMGIGFTLTGLYYNTRVAEEIGMTEPPSTIDELEDDLAAAQRAGVTPLLTSGKDGLVFFPYQSLWLGQGTADTATDWVFGAPDATIDTPEAVTAARTLQEWAENGYLPADVSATDAATAQAQFTDGKGLFFSSGNWLAAPLGQQLGDEVGFALFPPADGQPHAAMSDPANFVIPAKAADADAAAAFLDFTFSDEGRRLVVDNKGLAPGGPGRRRPGRVRSGRGVGCLGGVHAAERGRWHRAVHGQRDGVVLRLHPDPAAAAAARGQGHTRGLRRHAAGGLPEPARSMSRGTGRRVGKQVGWWWVLPALGWYVAFVVYPLTQTVRYSFYDWDGIGPARWVGLENYHRVLDDERLRDSVVHSMVLILFFTVLPIVLGLVTAALVADLRRSGARALMRTVMFLPQVIPLAGAAIAWSWLYSQDGAVNQLLRAVGLGGLARPWLADFGTALPAVGLIGTWVATGLCTVLFAAGIQRLDPASWRRPPSTAPAGCVGSW